MEARMKLYKDECKDVGKELMVSGVKLRTPNGKILLMVQRVNRLFLLF